MNSFVSPSHLGAIAFALMGEELDGLDNEKIVQSIEESFINNLGIEETVERLRLVREATRAG